MSADREQLAAWVTDACERTLDLVGDLDDHDLVGPLLPTVNPLIWEIAHLAWFEEKFVLRQACGHPPILDYGDALYDSGSVPHDTRWRLVLPSRAESTAYMREVAARVAAEVLRPGATDVACHFARYSVFHYDWHTEAITYTRQTLGHPPPKLAGMAGGEGGGLAPAGGPGGGASPGGAGGGATPGGAGPDGTPGGTGPGATPGKGGPGPLAGDVDVSGGVVLLGALRGDPFAYDNEKWAHPVDVAPFAIGRAPVTAGGFAAFVDDGGYGRRELWSADGWDWRQGAGAEVPVYWRHDGTGWERRHFDVWVALEPDHPVTHVSWYEADAWCRWAGRRLPTEVEWEAAARGTGAERSPYPWGDDHEPRRANLDWAAMGTVAAAAHPSGDSPAGVRQMLGNIWEWTASTFGPYPNFERDAYHENSEQFFGSRKVLRGGSWATRSRLARTGLRNYFTPERRDPFTGFRSCASPER